jgi:hypothetical protein
MIQERAESGTNSGVKGLRYCDIEKAYFVDEIP